MKLKRKKNVVAARAGVRMLDAGSMLNHLNILLSCLSERGFAKFD